MEELGKVIDQSILNAKIRQELENANIEINEVSISELQRENLKKLVGVLDTPIRGSLKKNGKVTADFIRRSGFWLVHTEIPLEIANLLFDNPDGRKSIIINGVDNYYRPEKYARPSGEEIDKAASILKREISPSEIMTLYRKGIIKGDLYIGLYRICKQEGLRLFAQTLREHNLAD